MADGPAMDSETARYVERLAARLMLVHGWSRERAEAAAAGQAALVARAARARLVVFEDALDDAAERVVGDG